MSAPPRSYTQLEQDLRSRLDGARLVCEVRLDDDTLMEVKSTWHFSPRAKDNLVREYPAIGAFFMVDWGVTKYRDNEYWKGLRLPPAEQNRTGEAFLAALAALGLETFPQFREDGARRFLAPILAHGGIPQSLAGSFLTGILFPELRRAPGAGGAELVARWRRDPPAALRTTVGRFLLYGGKTAVDLLDRLIGLASIPRADLEAGAHAGLPPHILRAYLAVPEAEVPRPRATLPRPTIELDPWGDEGPVLRLPPLVKEVGEGLTWTVRDGSGAARVERAYPRRDLSPLPLFPADEWVVTARRDGEEVFERTFECFGDNQILCFGDDRAYLPDVEGVRADAAWVVTRGGVELAALEASGHRVLEGEAARFRGAWSGHRAVRLDLSSVDMLLALEGGAEIGRVPVLRAGTARPEFDEPALRDVHSQEGLPVRGSMPAIVLPSRGTWTVRASTPSGASLSTTVSTGDLPERLDLGTLAPAPSLARWDVSVAGPLGSDFRDAFVLVPGLSVAAAAEPLLPGSGEAVIEMSTTGRDLKFPGRGAGEPYTLRVPADETHGEVWLFSRDHEAKVGLLVTVPRVRWAFRSGDAAPQFGSAVLPFRPEDLGPVHSSLLVSVGRPGVHLRVVLANAEGDLLLLAGAGRTTADGLFRADLGGLRDTARSEAARGLRLDLFVAGAPVNVGYHLPAELGRPAAASGPVSLFDREFRVTVVEVRPRSLAVSAGEMDGVVFEERLPLPLSAYKPGDTFPARVVSINETVRFDARVFDPTAFRVGEVLEAKVSRVQGDGLLVAARGHELRVDPQRLPADRPARTWRPGDAITGKVVGITPASRKIRFSVSPFEPGALKVGDLVDATVFHSGDVILATVDGLVGYVRNGDRPPGQVRIGDVLRARVTGIDTRRDQIDLTCRPFNPSGFVPGDVQAAEITGIGERSAWVRLPGGEAAWVPLDDPLEHEHLAALGVGGRAEVRVTTVDTARSRIAAKVLLPAYSDAMPFESPFAALAGLARPRD